jgi:uncharacterized paraquat-inducible protein A
MIDNIAIIVFSSLIVYTVYRAVKLDNLLLWFSTEEQQPPPSSKQNVRK